MDKEITARDMATKSHEVQRKKYKDYPLEMQRRANIKWKKLKVKSKTPNDITIKINK